MHLVCIQLEEIRATSMYPHFPLHDCGALLNSISMQMNEHNEQEYFTEVTSLELHLTQQCRLLLSSVIVAYRLWLCDRFLTVHSSYTHKWLTAKQGTVNNQLGKTFPTTYLHTRLNSDPAMQGAPSTQSSKSDMVTE